MTKRQRRKTLVFIVLGAMINVGVAFWAAWTAERREYGHEISSMYRWDDLEPDEDRVLMASAYVTWGALDLGISYAEPRGGVDYGPRTSNAAEFLDAIPSWLKRRVVAWAGDIEHPHPQVERRAIEARGWPFLALYVVRDFEANNEAGSTSGGFVIDRKPEYEWADWREYVAIPLTPLWVGFALNTIIYAAAIAGTWSISLIVRQWNRYRRGRCPDCAYDLCRNFSRGCSECGWRRAASPSKVESN